MKVAMIFSGQKPGCLIESTLATMSAGEIKMSIGDEHSVPLIILGYNIVELRGLGPLFGDIQRRLGPNKSHSAVSVYFYQHPTDGPEVCVDFRLLNPSKKFCEHIVRGLSTDSLRDALKESEFSFAQTAAISNLDDEQIVALTSSFEQSGALVIRIIEEGEPLDGVALYEFVVDKIHFAEPPLPPIELT